MNKEESRKRRGRKSRAAVLNSGRPRLVVQRSSANIYAQIVKIGAYGDEVVVSCSTIDKELRDTLKGTKSEKAFQIGQHIAKKAKELNLIQVGFDRAGYKYHGRVAQVAKGAREGGLDF